MIRVLPLLTLGTMALSAAWAAPSTVDALRLSKQQAAAAEQRARALQRQADAATGEAARARAASEALAARIEASEAQLTASETRIALIARLAAVQRARLAARQGPVLRLTAALQTMTRRPPALALVQPGSVDDVVRVRALLASTLPEVRRRTAGLQAELDRAERLRDQAEQARQALLGSRRALQARRAELAALEAQQRSRSTNLVGLALAESDKALALGEEARAVAERASTQEAQARILADLATLPPPLPRPGAADVALPPVLPLNYRLPVSGPVLRGVGEISEAGVHARGVTFQAPARSRVIAPAAGRVVFAGPFRSYGQIVIIDHGRGWTSVITQLAALDVRQDTLVQPGGLIGRTAPQPSRVMVELRRGTDPVPFTELLPG